MGAPFNVLPPGATDLVAPLRSKRYSNIAMGTLSGAKIDRDFRPITHFGMTGGVSSVNNKLRPLSMLITASVSTCRRKQNLFVRIDKAKVTNSMTNGVLEVKMYC